MGSRQRSRRVKKKKTQRGDESTDKGLETEGRRLEREEISGDNHSDSVRTLCFPMLD